MWDTSEDYRLLVAEKSIELFLKTIEGANLKGKWNKKQALQAARKMTSEIQTLYYSYLSPVEMTETPQMVLLEKQADEIKEALGEIYGTNNFWNWPVVMRKKSWKKQ
jgi:predicted RNA-binding protein with EMAP domain